MLAIILLCALLAVLFYKYVIKTNSYWKDRGVKQGNPLWIVGDNGGLLFRLYSLTELVQKVYRQCPGTRYSGLYQFLTPTLLVKDPDLIKQVAIKDFDHFVDHRTFIPETSDPLWGKTLLALKGQKWHDMRTILSPSFTSSKMKAMFVLISESAENFVDHLLNKNEDIYTGEMKDIFTRFATDIIATTAFGIKVDSMNEPNNEFYQMGKRVTNFSGLYKNLKFFGYFLFPKLYQILNIRLFDKVETDFFVDLVNRTVKMREEQGIVRPDMIHLLMEARKGNQTIEEKDLIDPGFATVEESAIATGKTPRALTNEDIASQALIFFFAGFDTVSNFMCFASYELALNPGVQERLRKEVQETYRECGGKLSYESLSKMTYMDMVVSEVLRKWPLAHATDRVCTKPYTIEPATADEKPVYLEKGSLIWLPIFGIHRDPQYYPDPERFDPERFNDENKRNIRPYTYFPFGLGPRNCIGSRFALLEIKTVLFHMMKHFEFVPVEKTLIPFRLCRKSFNMTADGGFWLGLKRIKG